MNKVSFIHCADLHLDSPFQGLSHVPDDLFKEIRESTFASLHALVDLAIHKQVDFVLIVGDLFDSNSHSLKAYIHLQRAMERLNEHDIHVYISYGNHDYVNGQTFVAEFPANVHVFSSEQVTYKTFSKLGNPIANIYGFSYEERAVLDNKSEQYHVCGNVPFHIGLLHGSIASNTDHDTYAPFLLSDLTSRPFHYWALGHIHARDILKRNPAVVYPGNLQGRSSKESGEKGCYYVELDDHGTDLQFYPLQQIRFETVQVDVSSCESPYQVEQCLEKELSHENEKIGKAIVLLDLLGETDRLLQWELTGELAEAMDIVNEILETKQSWMYIRSYRMTNKPAWDREELLKGQHFISELLRTFDTHEQIDPYVQSLMRHKQARKFVESFNEEEMEEIKKQAENWLIHQLLRKGG